MNLLEIWLSVMIQLFPQYPTKINKQMNRKNKITALSQISVLSEHTAGYNVAELHHGIVRAERSDHGGGRAQR